MNAAKHTPGPWVIKHEFNIQDANGRGIASAGVYASNVDTERVYAENCANAVLIAAAPDLLAACKVLALNPKIREELSTFDPKALAQLRAAITKAEKGDNHGA